MNPMVEDVSRQAATSDAAKPNAAPGISFYFEGYNICMYIYIWYYVIWCYVALCCIEIDLCLNLGLHLLCVLLLVLHQYYRIIIL